MTVSRLGRAVPFVGGGVGAGFDGWMMNRIAEQAVAEFQQQNGTCPDNASQGFQTPESYSDEYVASIKFGQFENGGCGMEVTMRGGELEGKRLWLEHAGDDWRCSSEIKDELLPANCRSH